MKAMLRMMEFEGKNVILKSVSSRGDAGCGVGHIWD